jgi:hypothetical protein
MSENKTRRYFKYAIGEIVLVVIGILIALQINNWNENRKEQRRQHKLVTQLLEDAIADSLFYSSREQLFSGQIESYQNFMRLCEEGILLPQDSILLPRQKTPFMMAANQSGIISNANEYATITNELIKDQLRAYTLSYSFINKAIEIHGEEVRLELHHLVRKYNIGVDPNQRRMGDFHSFCQEPYIQGILRNLLGATSNALIQTQRFLTDTNNLIKSCRWYLNTDQ